MIDLQKPIPAYLTAKDNIVRLILLTAAFALVFINIYAPFGADKWFNVTRWEFFLYSSLTILTGVLVVVVSRIIMYYRAKKHPILLWGYLFWIMVEVFAMSLFYTLFELIVLKDARFMMDIFEASAKNTALVLLLPYSVFWLYFSWADKKKALEQLAENQPTDNNTKSRIPFNDEKGELRFSVMHNDFLYLESADNYVNVYYLNKDKIARYTLRNTIKRLEENFKGTRIIRCHRSFMVNFDKVKVLRKEKDELVLELDVPNGLNLPVSKTYVESVMGVFTRFCQ